MRFVRRPRRHLFEAGKIRLHARLAAAGGETGRQDRRRDYEGPGTSPDRADAMVWGLTELQKDRLEPRFRLL